MPETTTSSPLGALRATCPRHGAQRFGRDDQREWFICRACLEAGTFPLAVVFDEDLARNPDGGDVHTLDP